MTSSIPPDPWFSTINYNPEFFSSNTQTITLEYANKTYLKRVGIAISIASLTSFTGEVGAPSFTSISSGATNFHLDNLAGNLAPLVIRNQSTGFDTFYRQLGTTKSHIFQTNGTGTTNMTLANTLNTSSVPFLASFASAGNATRTIEVVDTTSSNRFAIIPSTTSGNLGPFVLAGDTQIVALASAIDAAILSIGLWTTKTSGIRITSSNLNIGSGGSSSVAPTSAILFNSTAGNATMTGTFSFVSDIILRTTQPTNTVNYLGYTVTQNASFGTVITTGVAYNNNATGLSITPGVYIFNIMVNNSKLAAGAGDINVIQAGISTSTANFVGGATTLIKGQQTYVASAAAQDIIGNGSFTFSVPTTATYYFLQQVTHTFGAVNLLGTVKSYWQYTRVA